MVSIKHGRDLDHEIQSQRKELEQEVEKHNQHDALLRSLADDKTQLTKLEQECFTFGKNNFFEKIIKMLFQNTSL